MTVETFVFGKEKVPGWFNDQATQGRVKVFYDDDNKLVRAKIRSGISEYTAEIGDSIVNSKTGLVVIKQDKAKQYNLQKNTKNDDEKEIKEDGTV